MWIYQFRSILVIPIWDHLWMVTETIVARYLAAGLNPNRWRFTDCILEYIKLVTSVLVFFDTISYR